jgi:hypothetical protein
MASKKKEILVYLKNNDLKVGTGRLSKGFGVEHRALKKLIVKYKNEFEEWGLIASPMQKVDPQNKGRRLEEYELNEPQAAYLSTLLTNNELVRKFKHFLVNEFFRQRKLLSKILAQKQNNEWLEKREQGKIERRLETDTIKEFVSYAFSQGSKNAKTYYMNISKMENTTLFNLDMLELKYPNLRDLLEGYQLTTLQNADRIVARALKEGMKQQSYYKDIYKLAKLRIEGFVQLIGKTNILKVISNDCTNTRKTLEKYK